MGALPEPGLVWVCCGGKGGEPRQAHIRACSLLELRWAQQLFEDVLQQGSGSSEGMVNQGEVLCSPSPLVSNWEKALFC